MKETNFKKVTLLPKKVVVSQYRNNEIGDEKSAKGRKGRKLIQNIAFIRSFRYFWKKFLFYDYYRRNFFLHVRFNEKLLF